MNLQSAIDYSLVRPSKALEELDRVDCEESLGVFLESAWKYIDPSPFRPGRHLDAIAEHLEAVTSGQIRRLVINIPPRMTKSSLVAVAWPAWTWAQREYGPLSGPHVQWLFTSYSQVLSERDSGKTSRLIASPWYRRLWGDRFDLISDNKRKFENSAGGYRLATSTGGTLTGEGGHVIVVDDPHNTTQIESQTIREATVQWWDEALSTRLNDQATGAYVIIMQRLYEDDLTGHVLSHEEGEWVHLYLPMEYETAYHCSTILGFEDWRIEDGELLCPERMPAHALPALKRRLGPFGVAGQLQQHPTPRGGGILLADYWKVWPPEAEELFTPTGKALKPIAYPEMDFILASVDTASTEDEENDFSAMTVWGLWRDKHDMPQAMLMDAWEERLPIHELVIKIIGLCTRRKVDRLIIEAKTNGFAVEQEIRRLVKGNEWATILEKVPSRQDKSARALACQPSFAAGQIWAPARNVDGEIKFLRWAQRVIDQCASLPKGAHDDMADTVTQAINHMRRTSLLMTREDQTDEIRRRHAPPGRQEPLYEVM